MATLKGLTSIHGNGKRGPTHSNTTLTLLKHKIMQYLDGTASLGELEAYVQRTMRWIEGLQTGRRVGQP
jgi:hypothetical protein